MSGLLHGRVIAIPWFLWLKWISVCLALCWTCLNMPDWFREGWSSDGYLHHSVQSRRKECKRIRTQTKYSRTMAPALVFHTIYSDNSYEPGIAFVTQLRVNNYLWAQTSHWHYVSSRGGSCLKTTTLPPPPPMAEHVQCHDGGHKPGIISLRWTPLIWSHIFQFHSNLIISS